MSFETEMQEKLNAYSDELNLHEQLSLDGLIESHRYLRSLNSKKNIAHREKCKEEAILAEKAARERGMQMGWYSLDCLRDMSLRDIANLLADD